MKVRGLFIIFVTLGIASTSQAQITATKRILQSYYLIDSICSSLLSEIALRTKCVLIEEENIDTNGILNLKTKFETCLYSSDLEKSIVDSLELFTTLRNRFYRYEMLHPDESINVNSDAVKRLEVLNVASNSKISELGFGNGYLLRLIGLVSIEGVEIFANEINNTYLEKAKASISRHCLPENNESYKFIKGTRTSTGLEGKELDIIYMENVFHHFSFKQAMLNSIEKSLNKNGRLILFEDISKKCSLSLTIEEIRNIMHESIFTESLVDTLPMSGKIIIEYKKYSD